MRIYSLREKLAISAACIWGLFVAGFALAGVISALLDARDIARMLLLVAFEILLGGIILGLIIFLLVIVIQIWRREI